jgi:hypothetical protein
MDDDGGDYYYGHDKYSMNDKDKGKGKGKGVNRPMPSVTPSTVSPSQQPQKEIHPTVAPHKEEIIIIPSKKEMKDKKNKSKDRDSKKITRPSGGKGKGGKGKGKGKGDDGGEGNMGPCSSQVAMQISNTIPDVMTRNPISCCYSTGSVSIFSTHALPSKYTMSGFEPFWDVIYNEIERTSQAQNVCFVMTGLSSTTSDRSIEQILFDVISFVSGISSVASIITTDPTTGNTNLIEEVRRIFTDASLPLIGVFNAGYNNIIIESIVSGDDRIPYIGYLDDIEYGRMAGLVTLDLLNGVPAVPLCFNSRIGSIAFLGDRCAAYYNELSSTPIVPEMGVGCSSNSTVTDLIPIINDKTRGTINAIWAPLECCSIVADSVDMIRRDNASRLILVGCQDADPTMGRINFYTAPPLALQGYAAASWANYPVLQTNQRGSIDGRAREYFQSLQSLINTAIYNTVLVT